MSELALLLAIPFVGAVWLGWTGHGPRAAAVNLLFSGATFAASCVVAMRVLADGSRMAADELFFVDALSGFLVVLTALVAFTTAWFSRAYMRVEADRGKVGRKALRLYHSMFQLFVGMMLVALTTNNLGILWVALEAATLATVLLVSLYRTPASLEAAWKYFILCGVGIAQALFGTVLLYLAASRVMGEGPMSLLWTHLDAVKEQLEPSIMGIAFVFLLVGYGTKVGLAPLHNWLPDAHAEGPTPISAVLSGLLLNVALYALVRCKVLVDGALGTHLAGGLMMAFGLASVVGIVTLAFGMGGALASFAGLLHMTVHSLTKSAIFFAVGHAAQKAGTQMIEDIRGLSHLSPAVGWGLMVGTLAILGLPPFGVFASEFMILSAAMQQHPWAAAVLLVALGVAFASVFFKVQGMVFGETTLQPLPHRPAIFPVFLHLALVLMLGLYVPPYLAAWYREAARMIG